jgi:D-alanyl-D-alanine carboxypeptidase
VQKIAQGAAPKGSIALTLASVSKMFTATTVLSLVDESKLSLEDTLDKWLPASVVTNIANRKDITIRQLLNHTSGIPDYFIELKLSSAT